jgi:type VI secretion system protein VasL
MANNSLVTSVTHTNVDVVTGKQKKYWTEVQLVDELGHSVSGMSFKIENDATRCNFTSVYTGNSDADGVIRVENLHWLDLTLTIDAQQLADEMESRTLAVPRNPTHQPQSAKSFIARSKGAKSSFKSEVQEKAESEGFLYQYVTIGELCNQAPEIEGWDQTELPEFHFPPQRSLKGYSIEKKNLNRRVVIEICPFRAWILDLHDTKDYSLANGLNLGIMADLAYSDEKNSRLIQNFFLKKCQDLSTIPQFAEYPSYYHTLAVDVPFSQRYLKPTYINTRETEQPEGDTRLFYVECSTHLIVAWCGTDSLLNAVTDASFGPKKCPDSLLIQERFMVGFLMLTI